MDKDILFYTSLIKQDGILDFNKLHLDPFQFSKERNWKGSKRKLHLV